MVDTVDSNPKPYEQKTSEAENCPLFIFLQWTRWTESALSTVGHHKSRSNYGSSEIPSVRADIPE